MATTKQREEFLVRLCSSVRCGPNIALALGRKLLRHARTHGNLAEEECNGPGVYIHRIPYPRAGELIEAWQAKLEKRQESCERRIRELCAKLGVTVLFQGDQRGCTVKIRYPGRTYREDEAEGVPQ